MNGQSGSGDPFKKPEEKKLESSPPPEVGVRSMGSDISSVQRGEVAPSPESVIPKDLEKDPVFRPETQTGGGADFPIADEAVPVGPKNSKKIWLWLVLGIVVIGAGAAGYFFIYPTFFSSPPVAIEPPPPADIITSLTHSSFFIIPAQSRADISLNNLLVSTIISTLQNLSLDRQPDGSIQEVVISDSQNNQVPWSSFGAAFIPNLSSESLASWFEDDFTAFLYYNTQGVWPGFVAKIKNGVNMDAIKSNITAVESSDLSKFYLTPNLTFGPFKDGQVNGIPTRYSVGSAPGAALNYGIINNYLVISASYDGLKSAASLLGSF
jgi:hypothetical protein